MATPTARSAGSVSHMTERPIACIIDSRWISKVGKHIVKLGFDGEPAEEIWMTDRQLAQITCLFARTPNGHSSERLQIIGCWNDRGYYAYARLQRTSFIRPPQLRLDDLKETP